MRRLPLAIGFLLLLAPGAAGAVDCASFGSSKAISQHYVQKVLDRADAGIAYAKESKALDDFPFSFAFWARSVGGTLARVVDSRQSLTERADDLESTTACLRFDQILLECKMEEVRKELDAQLERGSFFAIMQLQSLIMFLHERTAQLALGNADGSYADATWRYQRLFDREPPAPLTEPLCPFHSDYTPPRLTGYGCDATILRPIVFNTSAGMDFAEAELQALLSIETAIAEFREIAGLMQSAAGGQNRTPRLVVSIMTNRESRNGVPGQAEILRESESTRARLSRLATTSWPPAVVESSDWGMTFDDLSPAAAAGAALIDWETLRQELAKFNPGEQAGASIVVATYIYDPSGNIVTVRNALFGPSFSVSPYVGSASEREHKTIIGCQEETGVCSDDSQYICGSDEFCASKGKGRCLRDAERPTIPKRALRGPFSYATDHLDLLEEFVQKRMDDGFSRTFPEEWTRTEDLEKDGAAAKKRSEDDPVLLSARTSLRIYFRTVSALQGREEGSVFPEASDSQLEIAESLSDMRASIGELSRLASKPDGVRGLVVDIAYFLRRTCAFRPCQKSLEQVIRISLQDDCFPYTNGEFLEDSEGSPRWKKCALAACIQVDDERGNPLQLPGNCQEILP